MDDFREQGQQYAQLDVKVEAPATDAAQETVASATVTKHVAILVCHGMGQQVQFETLDSVARALRTTAVECGTASSNDGIAVSLHSNNDSFIGRATVPLTKPDGSIVEAHFYEAYWAPITEGQVTLRETLSLFLEAGRSGLRFAYHDGVFDRWMFGGRQEFEIPVRRILQLGFGVWVLLLLAFAVTAVGVLPLSSLFGLVKNGKGTAPLAIIAAAAFSIAIFIILIVVAAVLIAPHVNSDGASDRPKSVSQAPIGILAPLKTHRRLMVLLLVLLICASSLIPVALGWRMYSHWLLPAVLNPPAHKLSAMVAFIVFVAEVALLFVVRRFLIQYTGDVAAYVSPFKVSKFEEIRKQIQLRGRVAARYIYSATEGENFLYDSVFVVGHSLGSVLAYDTLNDAINRDIHKDGWGSGSPENAFRVVDRTKLLLTFGSPLDKTAFMFRTQKTQTEIDVREALAASMQPMIVDYAKRPEHWINLFSRSDWISGPLGYYDPPGNTRSRNVCNIENRGPTIPSAAHTAYWTGPLLPAVLHSALVGLCPRALPDPAKRSVLDAFPGCVVAP